MSKVTIKIKFFFTKLYQKNVFYQNHFYSVHAVQMQCSYCLCMRIDNSPLNVLF